MRFYRILPLALCLALVVPSSGVARPADGHRFEIDPSHSSVEFKVRHLGISTVTGRFEQFSGTIDYDPENPEASSVEVVIVAASVNTDVERRDNHLRSDDFFDVDNHAELSFRSTAVRDLGDGLFEVDGELSIRGTVRVVTLEAELGGMIERPGRDGARKTVAFSAETRINRHDFGLTWNRTLDSGGFVVGDQIRIYLEIEANAPVPTS